MPEDGRAFATETVPVASLRPHPRNYRTHPDDQILHLQQSIRQFGLYRNIVTARDGTILAGHGVTQAIRALGWAEVPVVRLDLDPEDPRALKLLAADNEVSHLVENDDRALATLLKEIKDTAPEGLLGTGYDEAMVANLLMVTRSASEVATFDEAAHWVGMPEYVPPEILWKLTLSFDSLEERNRILALLEISTVLGRDSKMASAHYPETPRDDLSAIRFEATADAS